MRSGHKTSRWIVGVTIAAGTAGAILAFAGIATPARIPLVLLALIAAPAAAVAGLLPGFDLLARVVVAGSAALVINVAVAAAMLVAGIWSPVSGLAAVLLISVLLTVVRLLARPLTVTAANPAADTQHAA